MRLHGSTKIYASSYTDAELDEWSRRIADWRSARNGGRDVYVYFDNDAKAYAPFDAQRLMVRATKG